MKLITRKGQLDLSQDFSMTMERNNPLLSGEGDSSIPASLPASTRNLAIIGHRERIDRAYRYVNKEEAILEVGPVHKRGQLVIDSVHRFDGIDASFAIDNSDLYVKSKNKSLKDIIAEYRDGLGIKIPFSDVDNACRYFIEIYKGTYTNTDFFVFPVAVSPYEVGDDDNKEKVYQYNNEVGGPNGLVYEERIVREGEINMLVPEGYGITPFLKLHRMVEIIFQCLGYHVTQNCFIEWPYKEIAVVHNCSDCLVRPLLDYKDLVPSCTLSEFLEWLLAKFHVQPVVDSESKEVRIVKMEDILTAALDPNLNPDISKMVEGDWKVQLNPSKRVVLTPNCELEDTEPAAETFDKLIEKYEGYVNCNESHFQSLSGFNPAYYDCLILRMATGEFYLIERNINTGEAKPKRLGTNYFTYDRNNSDETEGFSQNDVMPLMLCGPKKETVPYIGQRAHAHTQYGDKSDDSEQKIIVVLAHTSNQFVYRTTGTTQRYIPFASNDLFYVYPFGMDNYSLYPVFWDHYNRLLLNYPVHISGRLKLNIAQFLSFDTSTLKLCDGKRLLPVNVSAQIGEKMGLTDAEFVIADEYVDGVVDNEIEPTTSNGLRWEITNNAEEIAQSLWPQVQSHYTAPYMQDLEYADIYYNGCNINYNSGSLQPGMPHELGETKTISMMATIVIHVHEVLEFFGGGTTSNDWDESFPNQIVTFYLEAVNA